jgi:DNA-binding LacI/PurR family transcriptional regulator/DNA-binding transcriptional regulator YhcF (GntR family)
MIDIELDQSSQTPLYQQLTDAVTAAVRSGRLRPGDRLPPEAKMASELKLNPFTVSRGYAELARRGIVSQRRGVGTLVTPDARCVLGVKGASGLRRIIFVTGVGELENIHRATRFLMLDVLAGVSAAARARGAEVQIEAEMPSRLPQGREEGLLLVNMHPDAARQNRLLIAEAVQGGLPMVTVGPQSIWPGIPNFGYSRYRAARLVCRHLTECGYRSIGFIGEVGAAVYGPRMKFTGYVEELHEAGLDLRARHVVEASLVPGQAHRAVEQMLRNGAPPEVIFADTDFKAMEAILALRARGLSTPEDVGVAGYDGILEGRVFDPPLTTVATPRKEIGRRAAEALMDWPDGPPPADALAEPELLPGRSTRRKELRA